MISLSIYGMLVWRVVRITRGRSRQRLRVIKSVGDTKHYRAAFRTHKKYDGLSRWMISHLSKRQNYHKPRTRGILITFNLAATSRHFGITFPLIRVFMLRTLSFTLPKSTEVPKYSGARYISFNIFSLLIFAYITVLE